MRLRAALSIVAIGIAVAWAGGASAQEKFSIEIVPQIGHTGGVHSVAFSPDGRFALSGSEDLTLKLWEVATGKELRSFTGHTGSVSSVAFSPDGRFAISGGGTSYRGELKLWDLATGEEVRSFSGHSSDVKSVAFSPDGRFGLSGSDRTLKLWEVATGKELRSFSGHTDQVQAVAFSPDGRFALSGSLDKTLRLWEVATGKERRSFNGHTGWVNSVAFSPDGRFALSGSEDETLKLWDVVTGKELRSFNGDSGIVWSVAFSPDGRFAVSGGWDGTKLWELSTGRELHSFSEHTGQVLSVAFSPSGRFVLSGSNDNTLKLWELATGKELRSFSGRIAAVRSVVFSPDGRFALSGSWDNTLKLWELGAGKELRSFSGHTHWVNSVAFSPDGRFVLSGSWDKTLKLWDVNTGKELRSLSGHTGWGWVWSVAFSPDGRFALSGSDDRTLKLWELSTGRELRSFYGHTDQVQSVAFSPDGHFALSGSHDRTLKLWEVATGKELRSFSGHTDEVQSVAFSPDGRFVLSGSRDKTLKLWDVATGKELRSLRGHTDWVWSVAFSPDGRFALSGSDDQTMKLWELSTGQELRSFSGHAGKVRSVTFSPDGRFALSGSEDGTARIWNVEKGQELARMLASLDGEWLTITPRGLFTASHRDTDMLALVRGLEATTIGQVHQSLFNPDLVREALVGDPGGEVKRAAEVINLDKVLESGPAPDVEITSHRVGSKSNTDSVTVAARITDHGKGIGRIEWRVNGITVGVSSAPAGSRRRYGVKQTLALDPVENKIEVIAYNARNLLASLPAQTMIAYTGPADAAKPKLHVLAIGINQYVDKGWIAPGESQPALFPKLSLAVGDAKALAAGLQKAGAGQYSEVRIRTALDTEATGEGLDRIVSEMSAAISPRDTFVFFAAAHGYSHQGRFYLIPQDYQGGNNPEALAARAIGQDRLQDWIANRIKAKKALILLDTCESGALTNGYAHSRVDAPASEAGVGRLHEATGRPVLTAAAAGQFAHEGVIAGTGERRGVFTWAVLDALKHGDTNGDGYIQLSELVTHVQNTVPGIAHGLARAVTQSGPVFGVQTPRFGSTGEDFAIVRRLQ